MRRIVLALALSVAGLWAQAVPQSGPLKDFNDLMDKAGQTSGRGDKAGAIKLLQTALAMSQKQAALKGHDLDVYRAMGHVYAEAQQYPNAIQSYQTMLGKMQAGCAPGQPDSERCPDVYYDLGTAQMYASDFAAAVITLRKAIPMYETLIKKGPAPDYKLAKLKLEANANSMLGAALFRSGNLEGGIAAYQKSVTQYTNVANNPDSGDGLQTLAKQSLSDAQNALNLLQEEQKKRAAAKK
jgi:tetratricopeptide (TPR) repeat protein